MGFWSRTKVTYLVTRSGSRDRFARLTPAAARLGPGRAAAARVGCIRHVRDRRPR
ncbi:hypothetical protein SBD_0403 [Streptomyces bottropensis ATCC 25435]|uniref:Uncharacterized protein n=1 Tax=Streptomyces bottropensis ATCC 25435 TaxID=1054862 RepID=M3EMQ2_9ACTN|nr:hypothetical protein SBD_0403 [Streptomyces bottropensis ATCC 25435]